MASSDAAAQPSREQELSQVSLSSVPELPVPQHAGSIDALAPKRSSASSEPAPIKTAALNKVSDDDEEDEEDENPVASRRRQNYIIAGIFLALCVIAAIVATAVMVLKGTAVQRNPPPMAIGNSVVTSSSSPGSTEGTETRVSGGGDSS